MKKEAKPDSEKKPTKMSKLTALVYSTAGIGLVTLAVQLLADPPKNPSWVGE